MATEQASNKPLPKRMTCGEVKILMDEVRRKHDKPKEEIPKPPQQPKKEVEMDEEDRRTQQFMSKYEAILKKREQKEPEVTPPPKSEMSPTTTDCLGDDDLYSIQSLSLDEEMVTPTIPYFAESKTMPPEVYNEKIRSKREDVVSAMRNRVSGIREHEYDTYQGERVQKKKQEKQIQKKTLERLKLQAVRKQVYDKSQQTQYALLYYLEESGDVENYYWDAILSQVLMAPSVRKKVVDMIQDMKGASYEEKKEIIFGSKSSLRSSSQASNRTSSSSSRSTSGSNTPSSSSENGSTPNTPLPGAAPDDKEKTEKTESPKQVGPKSPSPKPGSAQRKSTSPNSKDDKAPVKKSSKKW